MVSLLNVDIPRGSVKGKEIFCSLDHSGLSSKPRIYLRGEVIWKNPAPGGTSDIPGCIEFRS